MSDKLSINQIKQDLSINDNDLNGEMTQQAGLYAFYAAEYAMSQLRADQSKIKADVVKAKAYKNYRNRFIAKGVKFTESMLDAEVMSDDDYVDALNVSAKFKMKAALAKESLEALKQKRDMLVQKGVSRREEMKGEVYVKSKENDRDQLRERAKKISRK